ncbi:MAG TPA: SRPBCC family protein [Fimbriimonas sp.]|nr:SRPBCC family protein [Fimbriimonas sp.]
MNSDIFPPFDPSLDLALERTLDVPSSAVWDAWTKPELLKQWFTPKPWTTPHVEIDLRVGGKFKTTMAGPDGESFTGESCYLVVDPGKLLVWSSCMVGGFRPTPGANPGEEAPFYFTAIISLEDTAEGGTTYRVRLMHADVEARDKHNGMGFEFGWGAAADQMVELIKSNNA